MPMADYRLYVIKYADVRSILNTLVDSTDSKKTHLSKVEFFELQVTRAFRVGSWGCGLGYG